MYMPIPTFTTNMQIIQALADLPNATGGLTAAQLKAKFDEGGEALKLYVNNTLIPALQATTNGASGADQIGATAIATSGTTVQDILEWLYAQISTITLGQIPDGSLTDVKLSNAAGQIKQTVSSLNTSVGTINSTLTTHIADYIRQPGYGDTTGTSTAYVLTLSPALTSYVAGVGVAVKIHVNSGSNPTLNVNGLGAITLKKQSGESYAADELVAGRIYTFRYDGTSFLADSSGGLDEFFGDGSDGAIPDLNTITTAPNGGTVTNLWDMNAGTVFTTGTLSSASDQVVFSIDFGSQQYVFNSPIRLYELSINTGADRTLSRQHSNDGVSWFQSATETASTTPSTRVLNGTSGLYRYMRVVLKSGGSNCTLSVQGCTINSTASEQTTYVWRIRYPVTLQSGIAIKNLTNLNLPVGYEITTDNPCRGLILYSQGNVTVNGSIDMSQKAGLAPNGEAIPMLITKKAYKTAITSSLLHFNNNITDDNGRTWTNNGSATFDATNKKFGTHAISFNGTNQWVDTPASDDFSFGNDDFTIDFWMRPTTVGTLVYLFTDYAVSGYYSIYLRRTTGNLLELNVSGNSSISSTTTLSINTWYHIAVIKFNGVLQLYVNGNVEAYQFISVTKRCVNNFTIGRFGQSASNYFSGQIDEFRIVKGKAMYTADFTPPTAEYTYQATYVDTPNTVEKYFQLTNVLQTLRGGYGGNGGGSSSVSGGIGGSQRINAGGFGGGGAGGRQPVAVSPAELGGGRGVRSFGGFGANNLGQEGYGGAGSSGESSGAGTAATGGDGGASNGGGGGGGGNAFSNSTPVTAIAGTDGQFAGGFILIICRGNFISTGTILTNGGNGGNGGYAAASGGSRSGGGGGGGSGGGVIAIYHKGTYSNTGTIQANGGTGGAGGNGAGGGAAGGSGTSGSVGTIHIQQI
jgi:hypothetical protein